MRRTRLSYILLILPSFLWLSTPVSAADQIYGRVVAITDGDTLTLLTADKKQVKVRLAEIDTPESRQPYGTRARQELSDLAFGKEAWVDVLETDRYGRKVGRVRAGGEDVNAEMIRRGAAWVYRQYNRDQSLLALEEEARVAGRGLWGLPEAQRTPPWDWRKEQRWAKSSSDESLPAVAGRTLVIIAETANVRTAPSTSAKLVTKVRKGATLEELAREGQWHRVRLSGGAIGWVFGDLVSEPGKDAEASQPSSVTSKPELSHSPPQPDRLPGTELQRPEPRSCCKHCSKGQPCGNSCISWRYTCRQPTGCAC